MPKIQHNRILGLFLMCLFMVSITSCEDLGKSAANLIYGKYEMPTPYVTPLAQGTNYLFLTPYPEGTPIFDEASCQSMAGESFRLKVLVEYQLFKTLRGTTGGTSRKDMPPTIDEMRKLHDEVLALETPAGCEIYDDLQFHIGAEIDQTIRALVSFRNSESNEVMLDYFNEASAHQIIIDKILNRTY
jgi:hypothetical protein